MRGESLARQLGRATLERLHEEHGASFHLLDLDRARTNIRDLLHHFRAIYPNTSIGHSYKTNYVPALCRVTYAEGAYAEVVSGMEYDLAQRLGVPAERILLNGPVKSAELIERALRAGSLVNIDSPVEVGYVRQMAETGGIRRSRIGLRCNFALPDMRRSRFGLDADNGDLDQAASVVRSLPNVDLEGLHGHFGGDRSAASYRFRTKRMIELSDRLFTNAPPRWLDIGGGLAGPMPDALRAQFKTPPPTFAEYAEAIATPMRERYGNASDAPELIIEPGMGLFSDIMEFVCRVQSVKRIGDVDHAVVTGSIYNVKPTLNTFDLPTDVIHTQRPPWPAKRYVISGLTCMEIDILHSGLTADLGEGDHVVFQNTGAYTVVLTPPFIETAPAIISHEGGTLRVARRAQTLDDVLSTSILDDVPPQ